MLWILVIIICICIEAVLVILFIKKHRSKKKKVIKSLYKLIEERVLEHTLKERITSEQATMQEYQTSFLCVEFPDTKPFLMYLFGLNECVTIGRSRENKICIRDDMLSRLHCKISLVNGSLVLKDMMSANGTKIRKKVFGKEILSPGQETIIYPGDIICMGNYRIRIYVYYGWEINR